ncbi:MAG: DUF1735 and LamG domain-containing protein [Rikenellaceae bacterium]|nr:DUF1735 and LamG domain-containing protein [Rikenellaceae bacterium]
MVPNKFRIAVFTLAVLAFTGCKDEDPDKHHFGNKLYVSSSQVYSDLLIKEDITEESRTISTRLAMPAEHDITITFAAKSEMASEYNMRYYDTAGALPEEFYDIPEKRVTIRKGDVQGNDIVVNFTDMNRLDREQRYVLPVSIVEATGIEVLESTRTVYFVFKGAALINVVANIADVYFQISWSSTVSSIMSSIPVITIEALVRSRDWEDQRDNALSTIFGVEGAFLIRIGDSDRPRNQLQLVNPGGNWPAPNVVEGLPVDEWVHIALVYDTSTGERIYYMNGKQVAYDTGASSAARLSGNCYISYSYDDSRYLPGEIAELRIWNIQRTAQEIKDNPYQVDPTTPGLVAYWKFNEGDGNVVYDATGNGTNLTARANSYGDGAIKWVDVELPPAQ